MDCYHVTLSWHILCLEGFEVTWLELFLSMAVNVVAFQKRQLIKKLFNILMTFLNIYDFPTSFVFTTEARKFCKHNIVYLFCRHLLDVASLHFCMIALSVWQIFPCRRCSVHRFSWHRRRCSVLVSDRDIEEHNELSICCWCSFHCDDDQPSLWRCHRCSS